MSREIASTDTKLVPGRVQEGVLEEKPEAVAQVDLDGTLADFDGGIEQYMRLIGSPEEVAAGRHYFQEQDNEPEYIRERRRLIKRQPGFWANLKPLELGMAIFDHLLRLDFEISILTKAPKHNDQAWAEKVQWVNKYLVPKSDDLGMGIVTNKARVYGKVLVDDWPKYIEPWLKRRPRGLVLMPAQPWNESFDIAGRNIIRVTPESLGRAFEALSRIRETCQP